MGGRYCICRPWGCITCTLLLGAEGDHIDQDSFSIGSNSDPRPPNDVTMYPQAHQTVISYSLDIPHIPLIHTCTLYVTHTHTHTHTPHTHTPHMHFICHTHTHPTHMHTYSSTHMVLTDGVAHGRGNIRLVPICFCRYLRHLVQ